MCVMKERRWAVGVKSISPTVLEVDGRWACEDLSGEIGEENRWEVGKVFWGGVGRSLTRARLEGIFETDFDFFYNCFLGVMSWHLTTKHTTPRQGCEFGILRL